MKKNWLVDVAASANAPPTYATSVQPRLEYLATQGRADGWLWLCSDDWEQV